MAALLADNLAVAVMESLISNICVVDMTGEIRAETQAELEVSASNRFSTGAGTLRVTTLIGVASVGPKDRSINAGPHRADKVLCAAKSAGSNRVIGNTLTFEGGRLGPVPQFDQ